MQNLKINIFLTPIPFNNYNYNYNKLITKYHFNEILSMKFYPCKTTTIKNNLPHKSFPKFLK